MVVFIRTVAALYGLFGGACAIFFLFYLLVAPREALFWALLGVNAGVALAISWSLWHLRRWGRWLLVVFNAVYLTAGAYDVLRELTTASRPPHQWLFWSVFFLGVGGVTLLFALREAGETTTQ
jgi:hypothetical protein